MDGINTIGRKIAMISLFSIWIDRGRFHNKRFSEGTLQARAAELFPAQMAESHLLGKISKGFEGKR